MPLFGRETEPPVEAELNKWIDSPQAPYHALAVNLRCDTRVSHQRAGHFLDQLKAGNGSVPPPSPNGSIENSPLYLATQEYYLTRVHHNPSPDYLDATLNATNLRRGQHADGSSSNLVNGQKQLVHILDLNGLMRVFDWAGRLWRFHEDPYFDGYFSQGDAALKKLDLYPDRLTERSDAEDEQFDADLVDPALLDSLTEEERKNYREGHVAERRAINYLDRLLLGKSREQQMRFAEATLRALAARRQYAKEEDPAADGTSRGSVYITWAMSVRDFPRFYADGPQRWLQIAGMRKVRRFRWLMLLHYSAQEARSLYRPTQLDAGVSACHFPSPDPFKLPHCGGHPMDLNPDTRRRTLVSEFIHYPIEFKPDRHWHGEIRCTTEPVCGQLKVQRERHHRRLASEYGEDLVSQWMPNPPCP